MPIPFDNPTILAALIGAILGAILTNLFRAQIERRTRITEERQLLVGEATVVVSEHLSQMLELYVSRKNRPSGDQWFRAKAVCTRSAGKLMQLQVHVWRLFPEWYATAAMTKMADRANVVNEYFASSAEITDIEAERAMAWLYEQEELLMVHLADAASVKLAHPARQGFLGFNTETKKLRLGLMKRDQHDPAPWEPYVK